MGRRGASTGGHPPGWHEEPTAPAGGGGIRRHRRGERVSIPSPEPSPRPMDGQVALAFDRDGAGVTEDFSAGEGRILLGPHAVAEALRAGRRPVQVVFLSAAERGERFRDIGRLAKSRGIPARQADPELLETLAAGRVHQGVAALAGDYPYLAGGFYGWEATTEGLTYRWTGPVARIRVPAWDGAGALLRVRAAGGRPAGFDEVRLAVLVNGVSVAQRSLPADWSFQTLEIAVPQSALARDASLPAGETLIELHSDTWQPMATGQSADSRELGGVVDWVEWEPVEASR